jgi:hypothetical protein
VTNIVAAIDEDDEDGLRRTLAREAEGIGAENLFLGDAYDYAENRPLRHKPGVSLYATAAGLEREAALVEAGKLRHRPLLRLPDGRQVVVRPGGRVPVHHRRRGRDESS